MSGRREREKRGEKEKERANSDLPILFAFVHFSFHCFANERLEAWAYYFMLISVSNTIVWAWLSCSNVLQWLGLGRDVCDKEFDTRLHCSHSHVNYWPACILRFADLKQRLRANISVCSDPTDKLLTRLTLILFGNTPWLRMRSRSVVRLNQHLQLLFTIYIKKAIEQFEFEQFQQRMALQQIEAHLSSRDWWFFIAFY